MEFKEVEEHKHDEKHLKNANTGGKCLRGEKTAGMGVGAKVKEVKTNTTFIVSSFHLLFCFAGDTLRLNPISLLAPDHLVLPHCSARSGLVAGCPDSRTDKNQNKIKH